MHHGMQMSFLPLVPGMFMSLNLSWHVNPMGHVSPKPHCAPQMIPHIVLMLPMASFAAKAQTPCPGPGKPLAIEQVVMSVWPLHGIVQMPPVAIGSKRMHV